jgi:hypothetical protein
MLDNKTNSKESIEISIQKKQEVEKFLFTETLKPKKNQRVFQLDLNSMTLKECQFFFKTTTINYMDIINNCVPQNRSILIEPETDYVIKLNLGNALTHFQSKYNNRDITVDRTNGDSLNSHTDIDAYKN